MSATSVGASVRAHREAAGLSQTALGREIGISQPSVAAIEKGERNLRWEEGVKLRDLIGFGIQDSEGLYKGGVDNGYRSALVNAIKLLEAELKQVSS